MQRGTRGIRNGLGPADEIFSDWRLEQAASQTNVLYVVSKTLDYDTALASLYQAPHENFVAERKRLSAELKAAGQRDAAARLAKLARPPISAWVINQLYHREREAFDELFATAKRVQRGERDANADHRAVTNALRARAASILSDAGHASTEATLRRVASNLGALAATASFDPDPPGALSADRDPPGFEAWGIQNASDSEESNPTAKVTEAAAVSAAEEAQGKRHAQEREAEAKRRAQEREAEAKRHAQERAAREAERRRLAAQHENAQREVDRALGRVEKLRAELQLAETALGEAREALQQIDHKRAALRTDEA